MTTGRRAFYQVWSGFSQSGRCKHCGHRVVWEITDQGKALPFDPARRVVSVGEHPVTGAKFLTLDARDLHFTSCTKRPARPASVGQRRFL